MHLRRVFALMATVALGLFLEMNAEAQLAKQGRYSGKFGW